MPNYHVEIWKPTFTTRFMMFLVRYWHHVALGMDLGELMRLFPNQGARRFAVPAQESVPIWLPTIARNGHMRAEAHRQHATGRHTEHLLLEWAGGT